MKNNTYKLRRDGRRPFTQKINKLPEIEELENAVIEILLDEFQDEFERPMPYLTTQAARIVSEVVYRLIRMDSVKCFQNDE